MCLVLCWTSFYDEYYFIFDVEKLFNFFRRNRAEEAPLSELACPGQRIHPAIRSIFHRFHNDIRRKVAKGEYLLNGSLFGPASNMYELAYDCQMEAMAEMLDDQNLGGLEIGVNFSKTKFPLNEKLLIVIEQILQSWTKTTNLRQMVLFRTIRIGCSYYSVPHKNTFNVICIYDSKPKDNDSLYEEGIACSHNSNCTWISPSACKYGLCSPFAQELTEHG